MEPWTRRFKAFMEAFDRRLMLPERMIQQQKLAKRPEELVINDFVKARAGTRNIATAAGFLALTWSTVVLLGGFVTALQIKDFWFLTLLSVAMASKMWTILDSPNDGIYKADRSILRGLFTGENRLGLEEQQHNRLPISLMFIVVSVKTVLFVCVAVLLSISAYGCLAISVARLVQRDYGNAGGDPANRAKLNAALDIFYVLVLIQSVFVTYWMALLSSEDDSLISVSKRCGFGDWGPRLVLRYRIEVTENYTIKDVSLPKNSNLITYSVGLLESASKDDHLWGARALDTFIEKGIIAVRQELLSSKKSIECLIAMIQRRSVDDIEVRERAARILADIAGDLLVNQFQGALQCMCSLLESSCNQYFVPSVAHPEEDQSLDQEGHHVSLETPEHTVLAITEQIHHQTSAKLPKRRANIKREGGFLSGGEKMLERERYFGNKYHYSFASKGTKELISQAMVILERLTQDQDNCMEISSHQRLLSKITSPLSYHDSLSNNGYDRTWVEILSRLLTVVSRLISIPGDGATRLRNEMSCNKEAVSNLMCILDVDSESARELHEPAIEILTELASDDSFRKLPFDESTSMMEKFVKTLRRIFFEAKDGDTVMVEEEIERDGRLKRKAGEALARLLAIPSAEDATDAFISAANATVVDPLLTKVLNQIFSSETETAADASTVAVENIAESQSPKDADHARQSSTHETEQSKERNFRAAMLSLSVAINEYDFTLATVTTEYAAVLVKKLKEIIEKNKVTTTDCLRTVKLTCQVVIALVHLKPSCISDFKEYNFEEVLSEALKTMSDLDNCMLFAGHDPGVPKPARSLAYLVKEAQKLFNTTQQGTLPD